MWYSSVMAQCSNQRTSERAQLLSAMTHPSTVLDLDAKQSFVTPKSYIAISPRAISPVCLKCSSRCDLCKNFLTQLKIPNLKAFRQAEPIRLIKTCLALPKMLSTWPRVSNAIYST